jgi:glycerol uptake facilitator-like aquaporin
MRALVVIVQLLVSLVLTASLMPVILVTVPAARDQRIGIGLMVAVLIASFVAVSFVWPARDRRTRRP